MCSQVTIKWIEAMLQANLGLNSRFVFLAEFLFLLTETEELLLFKRSFYKFYSCIILTGLSWHFTPLLLLYIFFPYSLFYAACCCSVVLYLPWNSSRRSIRVAYSFTFHATTDGILTAIFAKDILQNLPLLQ